MRIDSSLATALEALAHQSHRGELSFGELVPRLRELGVESYHADYRRGETTFYFTGLAAHAVALRVPEVTPGAEFRGAAVQAAVAEAQRGAVRYPEFVQRTLAAGCVGYWVWISGRRVDYHGPRGEVHVEQFPDPPPARAAVALVAGAYAAFRSKDLAAFAAACAPDVVIEQSSELPWGGRYEGPHALGEFFRRLTAVIDSTLALERFIDAGDRVIALGRTRGVVRATGRAYDVPIAHVWTIRGGRIAEIVFCIDDPTMLAALA